MITRATIAPVAMTSNGSFTTCFRPKRIAIALPALLPFGGVERVAVMQAKSILDLGYSVDLVLASELNELQDNVPAGIRVINLQSARLRDSVRPFVRYLREAKPDAVHVAMWPFTSLCLVAHRLARSRARIIVSDHNPLSIQYKGWGLANRLVLRASLALTYSLANARVAVSGDVANDVASLSRITRERFTVIHNPMPLPMRVDANGDMAEAAWGGWTGRRIITVGRFKPQKNHALLIRAFKRLVATMDARLMILGVGELADATAAVARAEGVADKVLMPGQIVDPIPFYRSANLFVLSSDYEGFGNVIVEALACGVPVVSTDCPGGPAEILENGRYGRLVPVGDASALASAMAEALVAEHNYDALKRRAADFSPMVTSKKYLRLLLPADFPEGAEAPAAKDALA